MSVQIPEKFDDFIAGSEYIWFTTVNDEGMPQPTPVWFVRDGESFIIYTIEGSKKVSNIEGNPKVALGLADEGAGTYFVVHGEATLDHSIPAAKNNTAYMAKYTEGIGYIGMTPESFSEQFSVPVRVTATHVRGEVE